MQKLLLEASDIICVIEPYLQTDEVCKMTCTSRAGDKYKNWANTCVKLFGIGCADYLLFLGLDPRHCAQQVWQRLLSGIQTWHHQLRTGAFTVDRSVARRYELPNSLPFPLRFEHCCSALLCCYFANPMRLVQFDGSADVVWSEESDDEAFSDDDSDGASFRPSSAKIILASAREIIRVTPDLLTVQRWQLGANKHQMLWQCPTHLQPTNDTKMRMNIFVERLTSRVFIFLRSQVLAYDHATSEYVYSVRHEEACDLDNDDCVGQLCASWDRGWNFALWHEHGQTATVWSLADGTSQGQVINPTYLTTCYLTHARFSEREQAFNLLATSGVDGEIRIYFQEEPCKWILRHTLSCPKRWCSFIDEFDLKANLLVAACRTWFDNRSGGVCIWQLSPDTCVRVGLRSFDQMPLHVELRNGGALLEVCFPSDPGDVWAVGLPQNLYNVVWLDPSHKQLPVLLEVADCVRNAKCDMVDGITVYDRGDDSIQWVPTWTPLFQ